MLQTITSVIAKQIRRLGEALAADQEYLCHRHDPQERALLAEHARLVARLVKLAGELGVNNQILQEIDATENKIHGEDLYTARRLNSHVGECE